MQRFCSRCAKEIERERLSVLPETLICSGCAKVHGPAKRKGAMVFTHKTAPVIQIMDSEYYEKDWKKYNPQFGRGSGVHKFSKPTSSI